jgi:hypothetical protein
MTFAYSSTPETLSQVWGSYVENFAKWQTFLTLTFEQADRTHEVTPTEAQFNFRRLVQVLNTDLYGHHYTRIVGHSYFAYALAFEPHKSGLLHMHALMDNRTNWSLIMRYWQGDKRPFHFGIANISKVNDAKQSAKYLCKYITKGGDVILYKPEKVKEPKFKPAWFQPIKGWH